MRQCLGSCWESGTTVKISGLTIGASVCSVIIIILSVSTCGIVVLVTMVVGWAASKGCCTGGLGSETSAVGELEIDL